MVWLGARLNTDIVKRLLDSPAGLRAHRRWTGGVIPVLVAFQAIGEHAALLGDRQNGLL